uniref:Uncharacterized protein n=1 Tax=Arundo donax TaxID=35708 RepID=A0A0A9BKK3_ARUDO
MMDGTLLLECCLGSLSLYHLKIVFETSHMLFFYKNAIV